MKLIVDYSSVPGIQTLVGIVCCCINSPKLNVDRSKDSKYSVFMDRQEISFCPFCGSKVKTEAVEEYEECATDLDANGKGEVVN